jgi:hypothetical protein
LSSAASVIGSLDAGAITRRIKPISGYSTRREIKRLAATINTVNGMTLAVAGNPVTIQSGPTSKINGW